MIGQLSYIAATEHAKDLREAAQRQRTLKAAKGDQDPSDNGRRLTPEIRLGLLARWWPLERRATST